MAIKDRKYGPMDTMQGRDGGVSRGNWSPPSAPTPPPGSGGSGSFLPRGMGVGQVGTPVRSAAVPGQTGGTAPGVSYGMELAKGGKVKKMAKGGSVSKRADGCCTKGKTRGKMV